MDTRHLERHLSIKIASVHENVMKCKLAAHIRRAKITRSRRSCYVYKSKYMKIFTVCSVVPTRVSIWGRIIFPTALRIYFSFL